MRVSIQTLGCKVNQAESSSIEGALKNNNFEIVKHNDKPDICIINTCTVTAKSDYESRQLIRKAVRSGAKVIAAGCYAQLRADELSNIDGLSLVIGNSGKGNILDHVQKLTGTTGTPADTELPADLLGLQPYHSNRSRAFLKIQDGCNFACSYCAVPLARGKSRSLSQSDVISAAKGLVQDNYKEIVLTGIHIGSYGADLSPKSSLIDVIKRLADNFPGIRFRLSSIEPQEFKNDFLDLIKVGSLCPHLHIPIQSGSNRILKAMNRGYTSEFIEHLINSIITGYPDIAIGTDLIIGFPGETDKDFNNTVNLINGLPLSYLHAFPYSSRPDTKAIMLRGQVSDRNKNDRVKIIAEIAKNKQKAYMTKALGQIVDVIVEHKDPINGYYRAISNNYLKVLIKSNTITGGERLKVRVISLTDSGVIAEPLK